MGRAAAGAAANGLLRPGGGFQELVSTTVNVEPPRNQRFLNVLGALCPSAFPINRPLLPACLQRRATSLQV